MTPYYSDDRCTIYHGDARTILPGLGTFDLLLTDPPYGIGADRMTLGNGHKKIYRGETGWDDKPPEQEFLNQIVSKVDNAIVWGGNYFDFRPARCFLVWDKGTGDNDYADCELAWTNLDRTIKKFVHSWVGANAKDKGGARVHPTQKPLALMRWCLGLVPDAKTILDTYLGSGPTLEAAVLEGRTAVGCEINEAYCEKAANRLSQGVLF